MKDFLKNYGVLIGPLLAFTLGVIAIYIKFYIDRQVENWRSRKKMRKLIEIIQASQPPLKYYPLKSNNGFIHADQARNLTNLSIFTKRLEVILSYIETVENNILTDCSVNEIQQFHDLKFIVVYMSKNVSELRDKSSLFDKKSNLLDLNENDFFRIQDDYKRLITVSQNPKKEFQYIER